MRFKSQFALKDREGDKRVRRKFLLLPRQFGDGKEWRWLEYAHIIEQVCRVDVGGSMEWGRYAWAWVEVGYAE